MGMSLALELKENHFKSMQETKRWLRSILPIDQTISETSAKHLAEMRMNPGNQNSD
jgi:hypothetical protein